MIPPTHTRRAGAGACLFAKLYVFHIGCCVIYIVVIVVAIWMCVMSVVVLGIVYVIIVSVCLVKCVLFFRHLY